MAKIPKIYLKKKLKANSKSDKNPPHGKNPSNKGEYIYVKNKLLAKSYNEHNIHLLKPAIDKLVLRYDPIKNWDNNKKKAFKTFVFSYINDHDKSGDWDYEYVPNEIQNSNDGRYRAYKRNVWYKHEPTGEKILIQTDPKKSDTPFFRFDFNPSRLGAKGVKDFKTELRLLMCEETFGLSYADILKDPQAVYRMDIAVDILGVDVSDLKLTYNPHGNQKEAVKAMQYLSPVGRTQTEYPNALNKGDLKTYVYNKKHELIDKGNEPCYGGALHTRYEHRYTRWNKPLTHLLNITKGKTPLKRLGMEWIDYKAIQDKSFQHVLFLQYAKSRGIDKALEVIPQEQHQEFLDTYHAAMTNIWHPSELWEHWPSIIEYYGLLEE
ncbi:MAG: hypothetical protein ACRBCT_02290 [Alphaproteobacteria bacterium]